MRRFLLALSCVLFPLAALADDWPQFRGPERNGVSKEKGLLKAWPKAGLKPAWTCKTAGIGFSSVAVSKGVVYTLGTEWDLTEKDLNKAITNDVIIALELFGDGVADRGAELERAHGRNSVAASVTGSG